MKPNLAAGIIAIFNNKAARGKMAKGIAASFLGMLVMACSGCGGGGEDSTVKQPPVAPEPVQVSLFGDSTMAGLQFINGQYVVTRVVAADLQSDLQASLGPTVTVAQNAQRGTTLSDLLNGFAGFQSLAEHLKSDSSQVFVENFGLNDIATSTPEQYKANLIQYIMMVQAAGRTVVLEEPNPNCVKGTTTDEEAPYPNGNTVPQAVQVVDSVAAEYNLPLIRQYDPIRAIPHFCSMMSDGMEHPNAELYAIKAKNQAAVLLPIIHRLSENK